MRTVSAPRTLCGQLLPVDNRFVRPEGLAEILQIFAAAVGIVDPYLALHPRQRVQLRLTAPQPQIGGGCHSARSFAPPGSSASAAYPGLAPWRLHDRRRYAADDRFLDFFSARSLCSMFSSEPSLPNHPPQNLTVATTGASGSLFLKHFLLALERDQRVQTVNFIASDSALRVMAEELGLRGRSNLVGQILGRKSVRKIQQQANADIGANIASGSYPADAMVVIPCSMGTLARIANGIASQLIERAADVCLKEKRQLVLCVRETPLNKIHIRNMYRAADAGATVFPLIPAFYFRPTGLDAMAREFAYRVLAHIGLPQPDAYRWKG